MSRRIILWFRNDLRLKDRAALQAAVREQAHLIPVFCFDPREFAATALGFPKTDSHRAQFLRECVDDLRASLRSRGSDLIVRHEHPEVAIPAIAKETDAAAVFFSEEVTPEEAAVEDAIEAALPEVEMGPFWEATLHHIDDLPFAIGSLPEVFAQYRKKVEKAPTPVNPTYAVPSELPPLPDGIDPGKIPTLSDLGLDTPPRSDRGVLDFKGGETAAMERLHAYIWERDRLKEYKQTRNGMLGADYSSKFSAWLARGCLSPRTVWEQVQAYERDRVRNDSTYWLIFELLWRDYFRWICLKHGKKIFRQSGLQGVKLPWKADEERFELWKQGMTGFPLIDANMRELAETGFMSNRGRQNVGSFLTKNLGIDWRWGAAWFESQLVDYDVCSNWGNWNYTAGVGNDARGFRYFNTPKQSKQYDPDGDYLRHWLPELASIPGAAIHEPWKLSQGEQKDFGVILGVDYPKPVVDFMKSVKANERAYEAAIA